MKRIRELSAILLLLGFMMSCTRQEETMSTHTEPVKLTDYLYEISYSDYSPQMSEKYTRTMDNILLGGACTVVRNGKIAARNYDYLYSDMAEFVIRVSAKPDRYASIGVAASLFELTAERAESDPYSVYFDILPYVIVDGINEKGVFCAVNSVVGEFGYVTKVTNPNSDVTLYSSQVVRYVLDNCSSAAMACSELEKMNMAFSEIAGEFHFLVADRNETYIIEVLDGRMICEKPKDNILTNFYVLTDKFKCNDDPGTRPMGIERYGIVRERFDECSTADGALGVLADLVYSKIYDLSYTPYFYSEWYGDVYNNILIDINTPKEKYWDMIEKDAKSYKSRKRNYLDGIWITTHTSIYDLENLSLKVFAQEDFANGFDFKL